MFRTSHALGFLVAVLLVGLLVVALTSCKPTAPVVVDVDADGHAQGEDCDDTNATTWEKWCPDTDNNGIGNYTPGYTPACGPVAGTAYGWAIGCV